MAVNPESHNWPKRREWVSPGVLSHKWTSMSYSPQDSQGRLRKKGGRQWEPEAKEGQRKERVSFYKPGLSFEKDSYCQQKGYEAQELTEIGFLLQHSKLYF